MKYVVVSAVVTDEIHFTDGTIKIVPGGAGIYALCGIKLWSDDVEVVTGIGIDYGDIHGEWYKKNKISMKGLRIKDLKSPYTLIQYFEDGEREEIPRYGGDHFRMLETTWLELKPYLDTTEGMYIFRNAESYFWTQLLALKKDSKCKIMWEITSNAAVPENVEEIRKIARQMEAFSINMTEAGKMLGTLEKEEIVSELQSWGLDLIFLRQGAKGAVMISKTDIVEVPSQPAVHVVDPTGGGNSSTGAVLCGLVEGYSPEICGKMGSISAAMCISQHGVPDVITDKMRHEAQRKVGIEV